VRAPSRALARLCAWAALLGLAGCQTVPPLEVPCLASARSAPDFDSYRLRRVGILPPVSAADVGRADLRALQEGLAAELARRAPLEVVLLEADDLEEVRASQPHLRGWYRPDTIIATSRRFSLDGLLFATVTHARRHPPQALGLSVDLVAAETGLVVWTSSVQLDANDPRVTQGLQVFYGRDPRRPVEDPGRMPWELALLSPERFARFGAHQIALTF
jgi:hypothetical protein